MIVLAVSELVVAPLTVVPTLPAETLAGITGAAGGNAGVQIETRKVAQLPQNFADRFGWKQMTATVGGVYHGLPADQRAEACILTGNYGAAGAIISSVPHKVFRTRSAATTANLSGDPETVRERSS